MAYISQRTVGSNPYIKSVKRRLVLTHYQMIKFRLAQIGRISAIKLHIKWQNFIFEMLENLVQKKRKCWFLLFPFCFKRLLPQGHFHTGLFVKFRTDLNNSKKTICSFSHMPILGSSNSAASKMSKKWTNRVQLYD